MHAHPRYHVLHHLNSQTHWSELPQRFLHYLDQHVARRGERSNDDNPKLLRLPNRQRSSISGLSMLHACRGE